jgi:hypothetical protein
MGSLMAGWDSPVLGDDNKVRARRNRSLTRDDVEAFWKQRRRPEDGGEECPFGSLEKTPASYPLARGSLKVETTTTTGGPPSPAARVEGFSLPSDDSPSKSRDWWTRSSWAFLNEPPQEAPGRAQSYAPQFHVARIATTNDA